MGTYRPTKEELRLAREERLKSPDRGSDEEYAKVITEEYEDLISVLNQRRGKRDDTK